MQKRGAASKAPRQPEEEKVRKGVSNFRVLEDVSVPSPVPTGTLLPQHLKHQTGTGCAAANVNSLFSVI